MATRRSRAPINPGTTRSDAIVLESSQSQSSESSDSTTSSSHLADTQGSDENYDPDAGTQPIGSEGPGITEELDALVNDPHSTDTDMLHRERQNSDGAAGPALGSAFEHRDTPEAPNTDGDDIAADQHMDVNDEDKGNDDADLENEDDSFSSAGTVAAVFKPVVVAMPHACKPFKPSVSYEEIAPLTARGAPMHFPNTATYIITARNFDPEDPHHHCKLIADTEKHGKKKGFLKGIKIHVLPSTNRTKTVEIIWNDCEDYKLAKRLNFRIYWKAAPYVAKAWGPALPPRARVVKVHLPPVEDPETLVTIFRQSCHQDAKVTHIWTLATTTADPTAKPHPTGIVVAVVQLVDHGGDKTRPISWQEHMALPRWIFFGGQWYEASYAGRFLACRDCRGRATYIHAKEDCPMPWCKPCRKNHLIGECPATRQYIEEQYEGDDDHDHQMGAEVEEPTPLLPVEAARSSSTPIPEATPIAHAGSPPEGPPPSDPATPTHRAPSAPPPVAPVAGPSTGPGTNSRPPASTYAATIAKLAVQNKTTPKAPGKGKAKAKSGPDPDQPTLRTFFSPKRASTEATGQSPPQKQVRV
ncbi:hypothetical protein CF326_g7329 [Tilletia indica]|nr:hypothetical protein CF326_g7329 [Tilletia indica]